MGCCSSSPVTSVRDNITGPFADITVGADAVVFILPKELLCNSSTYFRAALNNGFSETFTQKITLDDDDPDIFRTYAVWLLQKELTEESLVKFTGEDVLEQHLFHLFIFADKRGIRCLANDIVTLMSSYWIWRGIATLEFLPLLPRGSTLYKLTLDNLILVSRGTAWDVFADAFNNQTKEIILELFKRDRELPESFKTDASFCFNSICHYHEHTDADDKRECLIKIERGRNIIYNGPREQIEWPW